MMQKTKKKKKIGDMWTTILIALVALVCITLATRAWFSIADKTRLKGVNVDITSGKSLRFDLEEHDKFEEYKKTLSFNDIADWIYEEKGIDIRENPLNPVTTDDCEHFYYENGDDANPEDYIEFTLHFRSTADMHVHLTSEDSKNGRDGTRIESETPGVEYAMRLGFEESKPALVYDAELGDEQIFEKKMISFGLLPSDKMKYNENSVLFDISEGEDVPVKVRIWLEGNDEACTNDIKVSEYSIMMRFVGTDEEFNLFS